MSSAVMSSSVSARASVPRSASLRAPRATALKARTLVGAPARRGGVVVRAEEKAAAPEKKKEEEVWTPPTLDPDTPSPIFGGSTGGLLKKAQVEEFYVITWDGKKEQIFEMPTGGAAIMRKGPNLLKLARKEQCLALTTQLRTKFKTDACFYRVFPNGEVQYLHPKDGVYPEKVNKGRVAANTPGRRIGENPNPVSVKFTGKSTFEV
mmetsp:Transcript_29958/g.71362  ORF Transcript_29958/g.71362 Transcript_29958/m.71362 type:complete len:207 (+) Transcript_29958:101-721(+)